MLHWPKHVSVYGTTVQVVWTDQLEDEHGHFDYDPANGVAIIRISTQFRRGGRPTAWAWRVLTHELTHACWAITGVGAAFGEARYEEAAVLAAEGTWAALEACGVLGGKDRPRPARPVRSKGKPSRTRPA